MNIKDQVKLVAQEIEKLCNVTAEVTAENNIILKKNDKELVCELSRTHVQTQNKRNFLFTSHELENHHYTDLDLYVEITDSEVEVFDLKHKSIIKHFSN